MLISLCLAVALAASWVGPSPDLRSAGTIAAAADDQSLYALGNGLDAAGVFRSLDRGGSWELVAESSPSFYAIGLWADPFDENRLFEIVGHAGFAFFSTFVSRSDDGGETWSQVHAHVFAATAGGSVALDPGRPGTLYLAYDEDSEILRSDDGGESFQSLPAPFSQAFLRVGPDGTIFAVESLKVWVSRDRGFTWLELAPPVRSCPGFSALAIDPTDANRLVLGTSGSRCGEILVSTDGGASWSDRTPVGPVTDLRVDASHPELIYAAWSSGPPDAGGVFVSDDDAAHWSDLALPVTVVANLAMTNQGRRLYAGTPEGIFFRDLRRTRTLVPRN